ncbi:hypothetical protein C8J40_1213 [Sphingomonas sp. PP-CC-3A-396]|nr:hypothetical protein C8J40_1293 [Sphingomonas sp. PP-CC-3A-396]TCQ02176.1 hypothetical protein C8J40_1213 [Sphingomonas sp. PP-CC-3A-396]
MTHPPIRGLSIGLPLSALLWAVIAEALIT